MSTIARILLSGVIGAVVCAILSFSTSFIVMVFGNVKLIEAFGYGFVVGMLAAFIGAIIGLAVGIGNLGVIGGGIVGALGTIIGVAVLAFTAAENSSQYGYFLKASGIFSIHFYVPTILTGIITALLKKKFYKP
jgi:ABC-type spermidine/putrescine transport system permease subunit II